MREAERGGGGEDGLYCWVQSLPGKALTFIGEHPRLKRQAAFGMSINLFFVVLTIAANNGQDVTRFLTQYKMRRPAVWTQLRSLSDLNVSVVLRDGRPLDLMNSLEQGTARSDTFRPRVLLVTSIPSRCETKEGDGTMLRSIKNKMDYARLHGMEVWVSMEGMKPGANRVWNAYSILESVMASRTEYDWYLWIEYDSLVVDFTFTIPWSRYEDRSVVMWGMDSLVDDPEFTSVNTGVFLLRNDKVTKDMLGRLIEFWTTSSEDEMREKMARVVKGFSENLSIQGAMVYLLATESKEWLPHVYFEMAYHMSRYWKDETENLEDYYTKWSGDGKSPPFIITYAGCQLCWKPTEQLEQCIKEFDRAFNFADDQVLSVLNLKHQDLQSMNIVKLNTRKLELDSSIPCNLLNDSYCMT